MNHTSYSNRRQGETVTGEWIREYSSMLKLDHSWVMFPEFQD